MASTLKIPSPLRRFTDGQASLDVEGKNVEEVLNELFAKYPDIKNHLIFGWLETKNLSSPSPQFVPI